MLKLLKYWMVIAAYFLSIFSILSQDSRQWSLDSVRLRNPSQKTNERNWSIDSVKYLPLPPLKVYEVDEYDPSDLKRNSESVRLKSMAMGILSNGDFAPFWLTNNQSGLGSSENNKGYLRLIAFGGKNVNISGNRVRFDATFDLVASNNLTSDFYIQQLYTDIGYKSMVLTVGAKEKYALFKNKELSSGGLTLSNNARPIPQVELSMPSFVSFPGTNDKLFVMGGLSYGWFIDDKFKQNNAADNNYAKNVLYHRKYGFLKFKPNQTWTFISGLEMDTQWGGHFYKKGINWFSSSAKLSDFFKVLIPMSGGKDSNITDRVNIVGNVYGSIHLIAAYQKSQYALKLYHEHFFEDHSGLFFKNIPDGLYGLEVKLKNFGWVSDIVFEYLHSKDQSGPFLWDKSDEIPVQVSGGDNYYNHVDYISLSNYGHVLGNPFFTSPIYNKGKSLTVYNTRLTSYHLGIGGALHPKLKYRTLVSYSRSWGTPFIPSITIKNQFSSMLEIIYNSSALNGWTISGAVAYDRSQMVGDNSGLQIKLTKDICIR